MIRLLTLPFRLAAAFLVGILLLPFLILRIGLKLLVGLMLLPLLLVGFVLVALFTGMALSAAFVFGLMFLLLVAPVLWVIGHLIVHPHAV